MTVERPVLCRGCARLRDNSECEAFPQGIPDSILYDGADHRTPIRGDGGIVFLQDPDKIDEFEDWSRTFER